MMDILLLRLDAPLMSFGAIAVDDVRRTHPMPTTSMLTGLLGNALGYDHRESQALQQLQSRLRYATRGPIFCDKVVDFQTADLGQPSMLASQVGWTSHGVIEERAGGSAKTGTHIRKRHYLADAVYTLAITLVGQGTQDTSSLEQALRHPKRPLFVGRKCCLPSQPIFLASVRAPSLLHALRECPEDWAERGGGRPFVDPREHSQRGTNRVRLWVDADPKGLTDPAARHSLLPLTDHRDWTNQVHVGKRWVRWMDEEVSP